MPDLARYEGDVYFAPLDSNGVAQGFLPAVECDQLTPGREEGDEFTITSKRRGTYGQTIHSETEAGKATLEIVLREQPRWVLAAAFAANDTDVSVSGSSVVNENLTVKKLDRIYRLAQRNIKASPAMVVTDVGAVTTYVLDTDYEIVDLRLGIIKILSTGAISEDEVLEIDYDYDAFTGFEILGETVTEKRFQVLFDGKNRISGKDLEAVWYDVTLKAPDVFDLLSSDIIDITLSGTAVTPTGKTSPYRILGAS